MTVTGGAGGGVDIAAGIGVRPEYEEQALSKALSRSDVVPHWHWES